MPDSFGELRLEAEKKSCLLIFWIFWMVCVCAAVAQAVGVWSCWYPAILIGRQKSFQKQCLWPSGGDDSSRYSWLKKGALKMGKKSRGPQFRNRGQWDNETMFSRWFLKLESRAFQNGYSDVRSMDGWRAMRARRRAIQIKNFHFTFLLTCCLNELVPVACLIVGSSIW